ncbi:DNA-3-methyladenine glycosylase [Subtercola frigoramans]|uniref:Putative 3-methyladenine DNA glycosylase n=1 Tax=Subtercola frigoramans TaxID=120298 RepID=A0ABS2L670_9MICO|nr:DNA-3-methyladenine glycosylase [Subtercola frigoramans]MBM7472573.1 DNA-3-methyladenine glycosylase [Subtercola frigoramans]
MTEIPIELPGEPADVAFFEQSAVVVAPLLLGAVLSRSSPEGVVALRITEVEAYLGVGEDPGSHSFRGQTRSNSVMFGQPFHLYTYFTYGMHTCANIVCSPVGTASAVLLRAGEIVDGEMLARARRGAAVAVRDLARGPARLTKALGIPLSDGGVRLDQAPYELRMPGHPLPYVTSSRTGVSGPGGTSTYPWRFFLVGERTVSPYRRHPAVPLADVTSPRIAWPPGTEGSQGSAR